MQRIKNFFHTYRDSIIDGISGFLYGASCGLLGKYYFEWLWVWWPICFMVFIFARAFRRRNKILKNRWVLGIGAITYTALMMAGMKALLYVTRNLWL